MEGNIKDGKVLEGQRYFPRDGFTVSYTQQMKDRREAVTEIGDARKEITPVDAHSSRIITYAIPTAELASLYRSAPTTVNLNLPPVLKSISVTFNSSVQNGEARVLSEVAYSGGTSGGLNFSPDASARASCAVLPDIVPEIEEVYGQNIPATVYTFFMPDNSTKAQVLTRLGTICGATVREWPVFKPVAHTFVIKGQEKSLSVGVRADHSDRWSSDNLSFSIQTQGETSGSVGLTNKVVRLPACIHGDIVLSITSQTVTATVDVKATVPQIFGTGIAPSFPPVIVDPAPATILATATVTPSFVPATGGGTIPTSGLYLFNLDSSPAEWEHIMCRAVIVDFGVFA